jgi:hypothetical protein
MRIVGSVLALVTRRGAGRRAGRRVRFNSTGRYAQGCLLRRTASLAPVLAALRG